MNVSNSSICTFNLNEIGRLAFKAESHLADGVNDGGLLPVPGEMMAGRSGTVVPGSGLKNYLFSCDGARSRLTMQCGCGTLTSAERPAASLRFELGINRWPECGRYPANMGWQNSPIQMLTIIATQTASAR